MIDLYNHNYLGNLQGAAADEYYRLTSDEYANLGNDILDKANVEPYFEYCNCGCKYEDSCGFCKLEPKTTFPGDAYCRMNDVVGFKQYPDYLVPIKHYKKLKMSDKYGFR